MHEASPATIPVDECLAVVDVDSVRRRCPSSNRCMPSMAGYATFVELEEIAQMTGRPGRSLERDWRKARAILHAQLGEAQADE